MGSTWGGIDGVMVRGCGSHSNNVHASEGLDAPPISSLADLLPDPVAGFMSSTWGSIDGAWIQVVGFWLGQKISL